MKSVIDERLRRIERWAQWLGAVSGGIYIPIEIFELFQGVTWPKLVVLAVNTVCVAYLVDALRSRGELRTAT